jgi:hypothetical protein
LEINKDDYMLQQVLFKDNGCSGCALIEEKSCIEIMGEWCFNSAVWVPLEAD